MKPVFAFIFIFLLTGMAAAEDAVKPIRGATPIPELNPSESYRTEKHDQRIPRNHRWQPPIIPHHIKGYQITKNVNTCMTCHGRKSAKESGATLVAAATYLVYYGNHIAKEEDVLARAAKELTPEDWEAVRNAVPQIRDPLFDSESGKRFRELRRQIALET